MASSEPSWSPQLKTIIQSIVEDKPFEVIMAGFQKLLGDNPGLSLADVERHLREDHRKSKENELGLWLLAAVPIDRAFYQVPTGYMLAPVTSRAKLWPNMYRNIGPYQRNVINSQSVNLERLKEETVVSCVTAKGEPSAAFFKTLLETKSPSTQMDLERFKGLLRYLVDNHADRQQYLLRGQSSFFFRHGGFGWKLSKWKVGDDSKQLEPMEPNKVVIEEWDEKKDPKKPVLLSESTDDLFFSKRLSEMLYRLGG